MSCCCRSKTCHSKTVSVLPRPKRLTADTSRPSKLLPQQAISLQEERPLRKIIQVLQEQLDKRNSQNKALRKRVRQLEEKESQLGLALDASKKREAELLKAGGQKHKKCIKAQEELTAKFKQRIEELEAKAEQHKEQGSKLRSVQQQLNTVLTTRRKEETCGEGKHTSCCSANSINSRMEIVKLLNEYESLRVKTNSAKEQLQRVQEESKLKEESFSKTKREYQKRYSELLGQLNRLVKQIKE